MIVPAYEKVSNEYNILDLSVGEWEQYAENDILYRERALGLVKNETEIMDKIMSLMPFEVSDIHIKHLNELLNLLGKYDNSCNMRKYEI